MLVRWAKPDQCYDSGIKSTRWQMSKYLHWLRGYLKMDWDHHQGTVKTIWHSFCLICFSTSPSFYTGQRILRQAGQECGCCLEHQPCGHSRRTGGGRGGSWRPRRVTAVATGGPSWWALSSGTACPGGLSALPGARSRSGEDSDHTSVIRTESQTVAAAVKSLQSCLTLCDSIDGSPPGSSVPGILQARILEWVAISFSMQTVGTELNCEFWICFYSNLWTGKQPRLGNRNVILNVTAREKRTFEIKIN